MSFTGKKNVFHANGKRDSSSERKTDRTNGAASICLVVSAQSMTGLGFFVWSIEEDLEDKAKVVASDWGTESLPH